MPPTTEVKAPDQSAKSGAGPSGASSGQLPTPSSGGGKAALKGKDFAAGEAALAPGGPGPGGAKAGQGPGPGGQSAQAPAPPAPGGGGEQALMAEDVAAFDANPESAGKFDTVPKVESFYATDCPAIWRSRQRDHKKFLEKATKLGATEAQVFDLIGYTGPGYVPMNRLTRGQMKSATFKAAFKGHVAGASAAMVKLAAGTSVTSQRGWREVPKGDPSVVENLYKREFVDEAGFMSTTLNSQQGFFKGPVSMKIVGSSCVDVKAYSCSPSEGEMLYPPGTRFKVLKCLRDATVEGAWKTWHAGAKDPATMPASPWFQIELEEV